MTHVITRLCLRDSSCVEVCPVDCIIPGVPLREWPWYYIDPDTCIDCGACVAECPYGAIFPDDEVPAAYAGKGGEVLSMPAGTSGYDQSYAGENKDGQPVSLVATRLLQEGEEVDLSPDTEANRAYFESGPGYKALEME
jgi:ferredoxin